MSEFLHDESAKMTGEERYSSCESDTSDESPSFIVSKCYFRRYYGFSGLKLLVEIEESSLLFGSLINTSVSSAETESES